MNDETIRDEIEALERLMADYERWGDGQDWDKFATLFHEDAVVIFDAGPRGSADAPVGAEIHGRADFVAGMSASLTGVQTAHQFYLPEITIADETHAHASWAMHDYVKTPAGTFNGWGHIHHDYVKVDGHWQILRGRTTRLIVDETWNA
ncbi:MAG TPA: nuclear transport factor 2 family protein [Gryllotalpicola sp.]